MRALLALKLAFDSIFYKAYFSYLPLCHKWWLHLIPLVAVLVKAISSALRQTTQTYNRQQGIMAAPCEIALGFQAVCGHASENLNMKAGCAERLILDLQREVMNKISLSSSLPLDTFTS